MSRTVHAHIINTGTAPLRLVTKDGSEVVLPPGASKWFEFEHSTAYRVACNDCGLSDGSHETWCSLWQPYGTDS